MGKRKLAASAAMGLVWGASAILEVGCGGSSSDPVLANTPTADGGSDAPTADAASDPYTLDNVCARTGPKICALRKPCCEKNFGYDEATCLAEANADCAQDVIDARAGRASFHPEVVDACLAKYNDIFVACEFTFDLYAKALKVFRDCRVFDGQLAEGAACTRTSQCKAPPSSNEVASCDEDKSKQCTIVKILVAGDACELSDGFKGTCDEGLYCDVSFSSAPLKGTCKAKTPLGQSCDKTKRPNIECGFGFRCDESGVCAKGLPGNAACTSDLDCASVKCAAKSTGVDSGSACTTPDPVVKREECKGP